jgi:hypothetical protein
VGAVWLAAACSTDSSRTGRVHLALDGSFPSEAGEAAASTDASSDAVADVSAEPNDPGFVLLPPVTPGASHTFDSGQPPDLRLDRVATFTPRQFRDRSVDPPEAPAQLTPSDIEFFPNASGDLLVVLSTGIIVWLDRDFQIRGSFMVESSNSLAKYRARGDVLWDNEGVLGLTFDPHFDENGYFYVHLVPESTQRVEIWRLRWKPDQVERLWEGRRLVVRFDKPRLASDPVYLTNHNGGNPSFGPDGMLYVALGDGGLGGGLPFEVNLAQDLSSHWGKLLRVDPTGVAPPEAVAYGLRNPFTHGWRGNEVFIGDVGSDTPYSWEEINRLVVNPGESPPPVNFGHIKAVGPCAETPIEWSGPGGVACSQLTDAVHGYRRDDSTFIADDPEGVVPPPGTSNRQAIIVGPAYSGGAYDGYLDNVVLYADLLQGWVRGALFDANGKVVADRHLVHHGKWITGFAVGPDRHVYMLGNFIEQFSIYRIGLERE